MATNRTTSTIDCGRPISTAARFETYISHQKFINDCNKKHPICIDFGIGIGSVRNGSIPALPVSTY